MEQIESCHTQSACSSPGFTLCSVIRLYFALMGTCTLLRHFCISHNFPNLIPFEPVAFPLSSWREIILASAHALSTTKALSTAILTQGWETLHVRRKPCTIVLFVQHNPLRVECFSAYNVHGTDTRISIKNTWDISFPLKMKLKFNNYIRHETLILQVLEGELFQRKLLPNWCGFATSPDETRDWHALKCSWRSAHFVPILWTFFLSKSRQFPNSWIFSST